MKPKSRHLKRPKIDPKPITAGMSVVDLVDGTFLAYNGARLREACQLFARKMLDDDVTIGMSLTGALTPAGLGMSALIPLIEAGFVDWIVSTGANLYHDTHFGIGLELHQGHLAGRRRRAARGGGRPHLRHRLRLQGACSRPTRSSARSSPRPSSSGRWAPPSSTTAIGRYVDERERRAAARPQVARCPRRTSTACRSTRPRPATARSA